MTNKRPLTKEGRQVVSMAKKGLSARQDSRDKKANNASRKSVSESKKRELIKKSNWKCHVCGRRIVRIENVDSLHDRNRQVWAVVEDVVSSLRLATLDGLPPHDDLAGCKRDFFSYLRGKVPPRLLDRWRDKLRTNVAF